MPPRWPSLTVDEHATLDRFEGAVERLDKGLIRPEQTAKTPERSLSHWTARMEEMASFLAACGDPHRSFVAIHVTGTSGKGSVATCIAAALRLSGYRVGLHTSPYLQAPTEKNWIDGELMSATELADLVDWVWPVARPRKTPENPASIHGMASAAIAFESFRRAHVDVAVIEAGCGGRFDLTNVLDTTLAVVTSVGEDHLQSLGPTVDEVAWHKAGIFKRGAAAVTAVTGPPLAVIQREASGLGLHLVEVTPPAGAPFWEVNATIARAALETVRDRFDVPDAAIDEAARSFRVPARYEELPEPGRRVILDGAHNPDKMTALVRTLKPGTVFVVGCLTAKDMRGIVDPLAKVASAVVATEPTVYLKPPAPAEAVAKAFREAGVESHVEREPRYAIARALEVAAVDQTVVVAGSLYLAGELRDLWYPTARVVLDRTSWPVRCGGQPTAP